MGFNASTLVYIILWMQFQLLVQCRVRGVFELGANSSLRERDISSTYISIFLIRVLLFIAVLLCANDPLVESGITGPRHVRIASEGALLGRLIAHGLSPKLVILSDGAGR